MRSKDWFSFLAQNAARRVGSSSAFIACCVITGAWLLTGPIFHWSDTWQLIINTLTNIVSMLMLFLIQNTQNREMTAAQLEKQHLTRERAHEIWIERGCPHGRDVEFWLMAERELEGQETRRVRHHA